MKRIYKKPVMELELFTPNTSVAYCTNTYNTTSWEPQTVQCVISSSDNIFGSTNCNMDGYTVVDSGSLTYVEGEGYFFIWSNSNTPSGPSVPDFHSLLTLTGEEGLKTILAAAGIDTDTWMNYHAGPVKVTTKTVTQQNWSM